MGKLSPRWLVESRWKTCQQCDQLRDCTASQNLFEDVTGCPKNAHLDIVEAIRQRAWPDGIDAVSGCCDSALHY